MTLLKFKEQRGHPVQKPQDEDEEMVALRPRAGWVIYDTCEAATAAAAGPAAAAAVLLGSKVEFVARCLVNKTFSPINISFSQNLKQGIKLCL